MKRPPALVLVLSLALVLFVPFAWAAATKAPSVPSGDRSPAAPLATALSTVTGIAISPLLGTSAYGAFQWFTARDEAARAKLPWYAQPHFWLPALLLVGICAAKDTLGTAVPPGLKKPLDVLETIENKFSGLVAAGAVVPFALDAMAKLLMSSGDHPVAASPLFASSGLATISFAAADFHWLLDVLTLPFGLAVFAVVWLASHAINVLILLSPWGAIDAALKAGRTALLGLITLTATINPWVGAALSLVVILIAWLVAGWAFRLMVFGTIFSWEFLTRKRHRFTPAENDNTMFSGPSFPGVPVRTYGRLVQRTEGGLEFVYRPWLRLPPKVAVVPATAQQLGVGEGLFFSDIVTQNGATLFSLPPRYRGHEAALARAYLMGGGVRPAGLRKAWSELRELLGGRAMKTA